MLCHTAVVVGLVMIGWRHFGDLTAGVGAAALYTLLPYTALQHRAGSPRLAHRVPRVGGVLLPAADACRGGCSVLAAGTSVFPALLFPLWFGFYSRRGAARFGMAFLAATTVSLGITALVLWLDGRAG